MGIRQITEETKLIHSNKSFKTRLYGLDNLKVLLTLILIFHHTAITYGGAGSWYYTEEESMSNILLEMLNTINQAYFLALFFFISGYFTPGSLQKKGAALYLKDRAIRLGIPLFVYGGLIGPLLIYSISGEKGTFFETYAFNFGPMWYIEALFIFSIGYLIWVKLRGNKETSKLAFPSNAKIFYTAIFTGGFAFLLRFFFPVDGFEFLNLQLGYFALYTLLFVLGTMAYRHDWLQKFMAKQAKFWFYIALVTIPILPIVMVLAGALDGKELNYGGGMGGLALAYAMWEPFVCLGFSLGLIYFFMKYFNKSNSFIKVLTEGAYAVYIIHPPVVVAMSFLVKGIELNPLFKFIVVGVSASTLCFTLAYIIRKIPYTTKVL